VGALAEVFDVSKRTTSAHFTVRLNVNPIEVEKRGRAVMYRSE
jgi:hypothetical protein